MTLSRNSASKLREKNNELGFRHLATRTSVPTVANKVCDGPPVSENLRPPIKISAKKTPEFRKQEGVLLTSSVKMPERKCSVKTGRDKKKSGISTKCASGAHSNGQGKIKTLIVNGRNTSRCRRLSSDISSGKVIQPSTKEDKEETKTIEISGNICDGHSASVGDLENDGGTTAQDGPSQASKKSRKSKELPVAC